MNSPRKQRQTHRRRIVVAKGEGRRGRQSPQFCAPQPEWTFHSRWPERTTESQRSFQEKTGEAVESVPNHFLKNKFSFLIFIFIWLLQVLAVACGI